MRASSLCGLLALLLATSACGDDDPGAGGSSSSSTTAGGATSASSVSTSTGEGGSSSADGGGGAGSGGAPGEGGGGDGAGGQGGEGGSTFDFGEPIDLSAGEWSFVEFPESRCLDDSPTGIGVNPSASNTTDLVIFLEGGGACFNGFTCSSVANPDGYDADAFAGQGFNPLLTRSEGNPFEEWSYVYVPYCTGDVHAGDGSGEVGGEMRRFRGHANIRGYLERLVPTFPDVTRVVLSGSSAGGFGAAFNYDQVKRAFGSDVEVVLLDDSGPPMSEEYVPACLQQAFRDTWGLDATLPPGCADCFTGPTFMTELLTYVFDRWSDQRFGLISSDGDLVIRSFWSFGNDDCASLDGVLPGFYPQSQFEAGVVDLRDTLGGDGFAVFMPAGTRHVWLNDAEGLSTEVGDSPDLQTWIEQLVFDEVGWQSWPE